MIFAGIVAGGCGSRMKCANMPKQFLEISGKPIVVKTAEKFLNHSEIHKVYIGIKPDWHEYMNELSEKYLLDSKRICIVDGGADRNGTVMNILESVKAEFGWNKGDIILTHDAVRPFVSDKIISGNIKCAKEFSACGTYVPAVDTIVKSYGDTVDETLDRKILYQAQTPQSFEITKLIQCFNKLDSEKKSKLTDTSSILTACGEKIHIVHGDVMNFKITTDSDLKIARALSEK